MSKLSFVQKKIMSTEDALKQVALWRLKDDTLVFTNGCFDILHQGHVTYLAETAEHGQRLVVGLNTDASVKRQGKGDARPINDQGARALVLASLGFVDMVIFFNDDTPITLIKELAPDVLAKGADYDPDETDESSKKYIVGSEIVKQNGGAVIAIPVVEGFSTTGIIDKLRG